MRRARRGTGRAVLDPGVLVSALLTPTGTPAKLLVIAALDVVDAYLDYLRREAQLVADPVTPPPIRCENPDDDYLIALAHSQSAAVVSGDP